MPGRPAAPRPLLGWRAAAVIALGLVAAAAVVAAAGGSRGPGAGAEAVEEAVRRFIAENPQFVIDTLNRHAREQAEAGRRQALDLVRANDGMTVMGNPDGDVTIYEFSDYNCGYCKRVFGDLMRLVEEDGGIRLVVKEFPILSEGSTTAARYALAAAAMGRFGEFHRAAMAWPGRIDRDAVDRIAAGLGFDRARLEAGLADGGVDAILEENGRLARGLGLSGTPAFVVGDSVVPGAVGLAEFRDLVARARSRAGKG